MSKKFRVVLFYLVGLTCYHTHASNPNFMHDAIVITREDLQHSGALNLAEVLSEYPLIFGQYATSFLKQNSSIGPDSLTGNTTNVLGDRIHKNTRITIDGRELPAELVDLRDVPTASLESVEISFSGDDVIGGNGAPFGSVVKIKTINPKRWQVFATYQRSPDKSHDGSGEKFEQTVWACLQVLEMIKALSSILTAFTRFKKEARHSQNDFSAHEWQHVDTETAPVYSENDFALDQGSLGVVLTAIFFYDLAP